MKWKTIAIVAVVAIVAVIVAKKYVPVVKDYL
jgi:hypothetical protein